MKLVVYGNSSNPFSQPDKQMMRTNKECFNVGSLKSHVGTLPSIVNTLETAPTFSHFKPSQFMYDPLKPLLGIQHS